MKYAVDKTPYGMIYVPNLVKIGMGVQVILRLLLGQT
jgi:hypothetical protein